ncbi:MAG: hypothetical protein DYG89_28385 [Caldilinea sp. CFX5]|nr:hypothetical protein [Caldilinea sp. CFX5]
MNNQQSITSEGAGYEQAILQIMHSLPIERMAQLLDFALFLKMQPTAVTPPGITQEAGLPDEQLWNQASIRSLAKYWDTPEEDEAWEHLQKAM